MFFRNPDLNVNRSWILYTMLKKNTRTARITRSHGTAFEPRLCVPKRRGAGSAPTTPYPPSLLPHHLASYHHPPSRTILVLTWMVHPQTLRNYLPHPCSFSASLFPPLLLLLPLPTHFFHSIFLSFFSSSLLWFVISSILVFYSSARSYPFLSFVVLSSSSLSSFRLKFPGPSILFAFLSMSPLLSPASPYSPLLPCVYLYLLFSFSFPPDVVSFLSFSSDPSSPHSVSLLRYNSTPTSLVRELVFPYTPLFLAVPLSVRGCV